MANIIIYTADYCPYCVRAKMLLDKKGASYTEINIEHDDVLRDEMVAKSGRRSVPQIFINDQHIGGCDDLYALESQKKLDALIQP